MFYPSSYQVSLFFFVFYKMNLTFIFIVLLLYIYFPSPCFLPFFFSFSFFLLVTEFLSHFKVIFEFFSTNSIVYVRNNPNRSRFCLNQPHHICHQSPLYCKEMLWDFFYFSLHLPNWVVHIRITFWKAIHGSLKGKHRLMRLLPAEVPKILFYRIPRGWRDKFVVKKNADNKEKIKTTWQILAAEYITKLSVWGSMGLFLSSAIQLQKRIDWFWIGVRTII